MPSNRGPGSFSTMNAEIPSSVRAASATMPARSPLVTHAFGAVDDVLLAVALRPAGQVARVTSGVGLGQGQAAAAFAGGHGGEPAPLLFLVAVRHDQRGRHGVRVHDAGQAHPPIGELLDDADVREQVEAEAAVLLRDGDAEQAEAAHLGDDLVGEGVGVLEVRRHRDDVTLHEFAHRLDDLGADDSSTASGTAPVMRATPVPSFSWR